MVSIGRNQKAMLKTTIRWHSEFERELQKQQPKKGWNCLICETNDLNRHHYILNTDYFGGAFGF